MPRRSSIVFAVLALAAAPARATRCPNLLFVLDQSGSMGQDPMGGNGSPSKWALATTAIQTVINQYAYRIPLGLELFTSSAADDAGCYADTRINVQPAHGTAAAILSILAASSPLSGTNTGEAIQRAATDAPALHDPSRRQYLVLITDGDPNCNSGDQ